MDAGVRRLTLGELRKVNVFGIGAEADETDPEGYRAAMNRFGPLLGAEKTGASVYDLPPGQSICPYHYEYPEEEWILVLTGSVILRHPGGEDELVAGDIVCFPSGPDGAHKVTNRTDEAVRVLMFSTRSSPAVAIYPDSDKVGIFDTGDSGADKIFRTDSDVVYYEGES